MAAAPANITLIVRNLASSSQPPLAYQNELNKLSLYVLGALPMKFTVYSYNTRIVWSRFSALVIFHRIVFFNCTTIVFLAVPKHTTFVNQQTNQYGNTNCAVLPFIHILKGVRLCGRSIVNHYFSGYIATNW